MSYLYIVILAAFTILVWAISAKSGLLRNEIFNPANFLQIAGAKRIAKPRPSFSLGRTQLAFWTVIIVSSFIKVLIQNSGAGKGIVVPALDAVNLALLGIASGTTIIAKTIDSSQMDSQGAIIPQQDHPSKGFFADIISDEKGASIHRLQNVIWTIIVGAIYIWYVATKSQLPDDHTITAQLLGLMGVSTAAYLGLKSSENNALPASDVYKNTNPGGGTPAGGGGGTPAVVVTPVVVAAPVNAAPIAAAPPAAAATPDDVKKP